MCAFFPFGWNEGENWWSSMISVWNRKTSLAALFHSGPILGVFSILFFLHVTLLFEKKKVLIVMAIFLQIPHSAYNCLSLFDSDKKNNMICLNWAHTFLQIVEFTLHIPFSSIYYLKIFNEYKKSLYGIVDANNMSEKFILF